MTSESKSLLVEGGGSHTWVTVADQAKVWTQEWLPSLNRIGGSDERTHSVLADITRIAGKFADIADAFFAVGAACTPAYLDEFADVVVVSLPESARPPGRTYLTNDVVPLFFTEDDDCDQLVVIAGTGSGAAARRGFRAVSRAGAHEYLLGDDGGAYDIGRQVLRAVIAHSEHRGPATVLSTLVAQRTAGVEIDRYVYGSASPKSAVADFARDVFAASGDGDGDEVASEILNRAAGDIARICRAALEVAELPASFSVTFTGTLLTEATGQLRRRLEQHLRDLGARTFRPVAVDTDLMYRTARALQSDSSVFETIAQAVPATRL
jgi:N-acetylglucosamine kinase-like BadF-type ATPase